MQVFRPDGKPVAGAKVFPMMVRVDPIAGSVTRNTQISGFPVPDELARRLAATTGPDGRGTIGGVAASDLQGVLLENPGSGRQQAAATAGPDGIFVFTLLPVGRLTGRVVVDDPKSLQGLRSPRPPTGRPNVNGRAEAVRLVGAIRGRGLPGRSTSMSGTHQLHAEIHRSGKCRSTPAGHRRHDRRQKPQDANARRPGCRHAGKPAERGLPVR